jgi:molybdenum cofactor biosynthesis protein MoaC
MLDVSARNPTLRQATARATLLCSPETLEHVRAGESPKGDPVPVARVAAIQAAKRTSEIIPYCHPLPIEHVAVDFELGPDRIDVTVTAKAIARTGVEMEALTAATVAALTLYDMLKVLDEHMRIVEVSLVAKRGGRSDFRRRLPAAPRTSVLVISDAIAAGEKGDDAGRMVAERLAAEGFEVADYQVIADDQEGVRAALVHRADDLGLDLVVTTGGTGFSPTDRAPEAMSDLLDRDAPGISEALRAYGQQRTPHAMLSRGRSGFRGKTLIVNLPGSRKGAAESLDALFPGLMQAFAVRGARARSKGEDGPA